MLFNAEAAAEFGVCVPVPFSLVRDVPSSLDGSGVVGRLLTPLKVGRSNEVRDGDGGRGVGGLL